MPDGRRCDTCSNHDWDEDPTVQKSKLSHKDNLIIIVVRNPKFFNLLRNTQDGQFICWWGFPQKPSGETQNT